MSPFGVFDAARTAVRMIGRAAKVQAYEVALMASVAAMAPHDTWSAAASTPHAVRDRQSRRTPHPRRAPCCSCTALGGTKYSWSLLAQALSARGLTVEAVT